MNPRIEQEARRSEFSPEFIQVLVSLTGATLLIVFIFERLFSLRGIQEEFLFTPFPWIVAAGQTIEEGLSQFSGNQPASITGGDRLAVLVNLLVIYVLAPTMFFFGWRHRRLLKTQGQVSGLSLWAIIFVLGGMLTFPAVIPAVPGAIAQYSVASRMREAQAVQQNKDLMINDLNTIAWDARQYKILPKSLDGGNGTFVGYTPRSEIASTENGTFALEASTNSCKIKAQSKKYPNATITVTINEKGQLRDWNYGGPFE